MGQETGSGVLFLRFAANARPLRERGGLTGEEGTAGGQVQVRSQVFVSGMPSSQLPGRERELVEGACEEHQAGTRDPRA